MDLCLDLRQKPCRSYSGYQVVCLVNQCVRVVVRSITVWYMNLNDQRLPFVLLILRMKSPGKFFILHNSTVNFNSSPASINSLPYNGSGLNAVDDSVSSRFGVD